MPKKETNKPLRVEMFRAGKHTDSSGKVKEWTEDDLTSIASSYNESDHEAPVVVGHPKHNAPAMGWIKSLEKVGKKLFANLDQMNQDFVEAWKAGSYKKRSASFYSNGTVRHLGFLGAMPPAIKGLEDFEFSEGDELETYDFEDSFDYMDWEQASLFRGIGRVFQNIREYFIDKESVEVADGLAPSYIIDDLKSAEAKAEEIKSFSEKIEKEGDEMTPEQAKRLNKAEAEVETLKGKVSDFQEEATKKDEKIKTLEAEASKALLDGVKHDFSEFCDGLVKTGHMKPADKDGNVNQLLLAHGADATTDFSEGDEEKDCAVAFLKNSLSNAPKILDFQEQIDGEEEDEKDPNAIVEKANNYMEEQRGKGKVISYTQAVNAVTSGKAKK